MSYNKAVSEYKAWSMPRWLSCSMGWSNLVFTSSKVINCILFCLYMSFIPIKYVYIEFDYYFFFVIATQVTKPTFTPIFLVFYVVLLSLFCLRSVSFVQCCPVHLDCPFLMSLRISLTFINTVWPYLGRV